MIRCVAPFSGYQAQQLTLENELALLVLLAGLVSLVILPAYRLFALSAMDVTHDVAAGGHVPLVGLGLGDVDYVVEEICFAMLAAEVLDRLAMRRSRVSLVLTDPTDDVVVVGQVRLAVLAAVDLG